MTHRERELAAVRRKPLDRVPVDVICIETQEEIARTLGISVSGVYDALGIDGRIVDTRRYLGPSPFPFEIDADEFGTAAGDDYGSIRRYPLADLEDMRAIRAYPWPDPALYDFEDAAARASAHWAGGYAVRGPYWQPLFCRACSLMGMESALVAMLATPSAFGALIETITDFTEAYCEKLLKSLGNSLDIFCLGDDFATQRGLMMSPDCWRRFLKPAYARLFSLARKAGKPVWFHSCGNITQVLPDLIDIGMDVWETVQLHTLPMTAEELKREYGADLTFFGGINTQRLPFLSPEAVRGEVRRCMETLGRGGGYICGPDHHIKPDVSAQNAVALFAAAVSYPADQLGAITKAGT